MDMLTERNCLLTEGCLLICSNISSCITPVFLELFSLYILGFILLIFLKPFLLVPDLLNPTPR